MRLTILSALVQIIVKKLSDELLKKYCNIDKILENWKEKYKRMKEQELEAE